PDGGGRRTHAAPRPGRRGCLAEGYPGHRLGPQQVDVGRQGQGLLRVPQYILSHRFPTGSRALPEQIAPESTSGPSRGTIMEDRAEVGVAVPAQVKLPGAEPNLLARKWNWLRDLPARSALRACNHPRVRNLLGQRHASALASHQARLPSLSASDRQIVDTVDREG